VLEEIDDDWGNSDDNAGGGCATTLGFSGAVVCESARNPGEDRLNSRTLLGTGFATFLRERRKPFAI